MYAEDDTVWRQEVLDRLDRLRTGLFLVALLALVALGVAAYTLVTAEEESDAQAGATRSQVSALDERVDELESQAEDSASKGSVSNLRSDQEDLADRVKALEDQAEEGGDTQALQQAIDDLSQSVEDLEGRVDDLETQQQEQAEPTP